SNSASTVVCSARASFSARRVEGTKTPFSTVLMVLRVTPTRSARSAWVQPRRALASRSRLIKPSATLGAPLQNGEGGEGPEKSCAQHDVDGRKRRDRRE